MVHTYTYMHTWNTASFVHCICSSTLHCILFQLLFNRSVILMRSFIGGYRQWWTTSIIVQININDINEFTPQFSQSLYNISGLVLNDSQPCRCVHKSMCTCAVYVHICLFVYVCMHGMCIYVCMCVWNFWYCVV